MGYQGQAVTSNFAGNDPNMTSAFQHKMPAGEFEVIVEDDKEMFTHDSGSCFSEEEEGGLHGGRGNKRET
jgi:hypothetical protein